MKEMNLQGTGNARGRHMQGIWRAHERHMQGTWTAHGRHMGGIKGTWKAPGCKAIQW